VDAVSMMELTERQLARCIDDTNLNPTAAEAQIAEFVSAARSHQFCAVAIMPSWIPLATRLLKGSQTTIVAAIGFPLGTCATESKIAETQWAITHGLASLEIDVVMNLSLLKSRRYERVESELRQLRHVSAGHVLKVIIEAPLLTPQEVRTASQIAEAAGADFIKTSTGFKQFKGWRPSTPDDVTLIRSSVGPQIKIKVAGGVSTLPQVLALLEAGASRIGTSAGPAILAEYRQLGAPPGR
jgi:deoxyribose-phosphate aldolase